MAYGEQGSRFAQEFEQAYANIGRVGYGSISEKERNERDVQANSMVNVIRGTFANEFKNSFGRDPTEAEIDEYLRSNVDAKMLEKNLRGLGSEAEWRSLAKSHLQPRLEQEKEEKEISELVPSSSEASEYLKQLYKEPEIAPYAEAGDTSAVEGLRKGTEEEIARLYENVPTLVERAVSPEVRAAIQQKASLGLLRQPTYGKTIDRIGAAKAGMVAQGYQSAAEKALGARQQLSELIANLVNQIQARKQSAYETAGEMNLRRKLGAGGLGLQRELGVGELGLKGKLGLGGLNLEKQGLAQNLQQMILNRAEAKRQFDIESGLRKKAIEEGGEGLWDKIYKGTAITSNLLNAFKSLGQGISAWRGSGTEVGPGATG